MKSVFFSTHFWLKLFIIVSIIIIILFNFNIINTHAQNQAQEFNIFISCIESNDSITKIVFGYNNESLSLKSFSQSTIVVNNQRQITTPLVFEKGNHYYGFSINLYNQEIEVEGFSLDWFAFNGPEINFSGSFDINDIRWSKACLNNEQDFNLYDNNSELQNYTVIFNPIINKSEIEQKYLNVISFERAYREGLYKTQMTKEQFNEFFFSEDFLFIAPDQPYFRNTSQWHDVRTGRTNLQSYISSAVFTQSTVVIIDDGVDYNHPALQGSLIHEGCINVSFPSPFVSSCPKGQPMSFSPGSGLPCNSPSCTHGTSVAGLAVGRPVQQLNYSGGVSPISKLISINVFSVIPGCTISPGVFCDYTDNLNILTALHYIYNLTKTNPEFNISSVNLSVGQGLFTTQCDSTFWGSEYYSITKKLNEKGVMVVASSGNEGSIRGISLPACTSNIISVGSVNQIGLISSFSNRSRFLTLLAPGEDILTIGSQNSTRIVRGTSYSAPIVSGSIGLIRSASPHIPQSFLRSILTLGTKTVPDSSSNARYSELQLCLIFKHIGIDACKSNPTTSITWGNIGALGAVGKSRKHGSFFVNLTQ